MTDTTTRPIRVATFEDGSTHAYCPRHGEEDVPMTRLNRQRLTRDKSDRTRWTTLWECPTCGTVWEE